MSTKPPSESVDLRAERAVLGSVFMNNDFFYEAVGDLSVEDFALDSHRKIYLSMATAVEEGNPIDMVSIGKLLERRHELDSIGGSSYLALLVDDAMDVLAGVLHSIKVVKDASQRRRLQKSLSLGLASLENVSTSTQAIVDQVGDALLAVTAESIRSKPMRVSEYSSELVTYVQEMRKLPMERTAVGFNTGLRDLDEMTTGYRKDEVSIIGAFTADGKTSLAVQSAIANLNDGRPVAMFTLELPRLTYTLRFYSVMGRLPFVKLRDPRNMNLEDDMALNDARQALDKLPLYVDDQSALSVQELTARAKLLARREKVELFFVDYIGLMKAAGETKNDQVTAIMNSLMELAKNEHVAVVGLSQLSRPDGRIKRRPSMLDLKDSGSIEQGARLVLMPYRPETKDRIFTKEDEIVIAKQTSGPTGILNVKYNTDFLIFEERTEANKGEHRDE
jgi:replicative DNA helicase